MRRLGYGVIRSKNIAEENYFENSKSRYFEEKNEDVGVDGWV